MKENNVGRIIWHIISLIVIGEIDEAIEIIKKEIFQCYARRILEGAIAHPYMNDDIS